MTLEESIALWERGEQLAAICQRWLEGQDPPGRGRQGARSGRRPAGRRHLTTGTHPGAAVHRGSRSAVTATFATAGFVTAAATTRMPSLRDQVDADFADFSFALLCVGLGSVLAMPWSGRLTDRLSSGVTVRVFGAVAAGALALSGFLPNLVALALCFLAAGVGIGVWDVSMNVQGHAVETGKGES